MQPTLQHKIIKLLKKLLKMLMIAFGVLLLLFIVVVALLQFSSVQTYLTDKITDSLSKQTGTEITIERVAIRFPKTVGLKGIYLEDIKGDTLLYAGGLFVNVNMIALIRNEIKLSSVSLENASMNMIRERNSENFNFQFLIDAFTSTDEEEPVSPTPEEEESEGFAFKLDKLHLKDIHYVLMDGYSGTQLDVQIGRLSLRARNSDILQEKFHVENFSIEKSTVNLILKEGTSDPDPDSGPFPELDIALNSLSLQDFTFNMTDISGNTMHLHKKNTLIEPKTIELHKQNIQITKLHIDETLFNYQQQALSDTLKPTENKAKSIDLEPSPIEFNLSDITTWNIELDHLLLEESTIILQERDYRNPTQSFTDKDIQIKQLELNAHDIVFSPHHTQLRMEHGHALLNDAFHIKKMAMQINLGESTEIQEFIFESNASALQFSFYSNLNALHFDEKSLNEMEFDLKLEELNIQNDLAFFIPQMQDYYFGWKNTSGVQAGGDISGELTDFTLDSLWVTAPRFFNAFAKGRVQHILDSSKASVNLENFKLVAAPPLFLPHIPDSIVPKDIQLPQWLILNVKGLASFSESNLTAKLQSDLGDISLQTEFSSVKEESSHFSGNIDAQSINLRKILANEELPDSLNMVMNIEGQGQEPKSMLLDADIQLQNLSFNNYHYDDIHLDLQLEDSLLHLQTQYADANLSFSLEGSYGLFQEQADIKAELVVSHANPYTLGFTEEPLALTAQVSADLLWETTDFLSGNIKLKKTSIATAEDIYDIENINIVSNREGESYLVTLDAGFSNIDYTGNFSPFLMPKVLSNHFSNYYQIGEEEYQQEEKEKSFELNLWLYPDDFLSEWILPQLDTSDTLAVVMSYSSAEDKIQVEATLANFSYDILEFHELELQALSDEGMLEIELFLEQVQIEDAFLHDFTAISTFQNNIFDFSLGIKNDDAEPLYNIHGAIERKDTLIHMQLSNDNLLLNGETWNIPERNHILWSSNYLHASEFVLESQNRKIALETRQYEQREGLHINIQNIDLEKLTDISSTYSPPIGGVLSLEATLFDIFNNIEIQAQGEIQKLVYDNNELGDLNVTLNSPKAKLFQIDANLLSELTDVNIIGDYTLSETDELDFKITLSRLDLPSFQGFFADNVSHLEGFISGEIDLSGTLSSPQIQGKMQFNNTSFRLPATNVGYSIKGDEIIFDRNTVQLSDFTLEDSAGRKAVLRGNLNFADLNNLRLDFHLSSGNFLVLNQKEDNNLSYHGRLMIDSDVNLKGNLFAPQIDGRLKLNRGSGFTFTIPQSQPESIGNEGIVEFVSHRDSLFLLAAEQALESQRMIPSMERINLSLNIEIDSQAQVKIIIDEYAGDFLQVKGGGQLSLGTDPGGRVSLTGRYEIMEGEYLLTFYDVIRRNFRIRKDSYIAFRGDPEDATLDITAIYSVRTHARDLMAHQISGNDNQVALRQQYPFRVFLKMSGKLSEPEISFELDLPQEHRDAMGGSLYARINQINQNESELNKQVFALLILGHFIQDNPFASLAAGGDLAGSARNSASQLLTQQLNRLSDRHIRGIDINLEVQSDVDYSEGLASGRTDLQMEVSRNFLNERLRFTVGGNIELEDESRRQTNPGDIAGDFTIEYLITPDGNMRLKAFRKRNYGDVFDREVTETGTSFIFNRTYKRFRDLWRKEDE